jgi:cyclophilin family peptidyl-prolyl cis-trans isomerase
MAILKTTAGDIHVRLDSSAAPITTANFIQYARSGHYDGTIFHRVIQGFMIQGGGMNAAMQEKKTLAPIKNESSNGKSNRKYTLAMARTNIPDYSSTVPELRMASDTRCLAKLFQVWTWWIRSKE